MIAKVSRMKLCTLQHVLSQAALKVAKAKQIRR